MTWTVACFCGTVFSAPAKRCPTCGAPLPSVTTGERETAPLPDAVDELVRRRRRNHGSG
jgi:hypothetical protein